MTKKLTIQAFSEQTGIPKSTLRYYEEAELLIPARNQENGYRLYHIDQIETAIWIASLRLANVPLKEIRSYIAANKEQKLKMKQTWIHTLKRQQQLLNVQIKFLENYMTDEEIYLFEKQEERVLWFRAEEDQGNFAEHFIDGEELLGANNILVNNWYLKYVSGRSTVNAWIGFGIDDRIDISHLTKFEKEESLNKSLCVALNFQGDFTKIEDAYRRLVKYVNDHHYAPAGSIMEMYRGRTLGEVTIFIPVMKLGGKTDVSRT